MDERKKERLKAAWSKSNIIIPEGFLSIETLSKTTTTRILAYYKKRVLSHKIEEWELEYEETIIFIKYREAIKALLNTREHVEKK